MKRTTYLLFILLAFSQANATNYYLSSSSGSDLNDGKTVNAAWKSITKFKTFEFPLQKTF